MKKKLFIVLVVAMVLLTACGGSQDDVIESEVDTIVDIQPEQADELETAEIDEDEPEEVVDEVESETVEDEVESEATVNSEATADGEQEEVSDSEQYETFEEAFNDPDIRAEIEGNLGVEENEAMSISCDVKVNNCILTFKLLDSSIITDGMEEALAEALEEQADQFKSAAASLDEALGFEEGTCTITIRYTDPDDNVLAEQTFGND